MELEGCLKLQEINPHDETEKQTNQVKLQRVCQFQKNYPKNIFIPMIEFLAEMGLRSEYQKVVGTREQFQGKNVVSLNMIQQLLSEKWLVEQVNCSDLLTNISNKILLNSKIKKKLFHVKVANVLLQTSTASTKFYKKEVSKAANSIASTLVENDQLFQYPSSLIYLLNFTYRIMSAFIHCQQPVDYHSKPTPNSKEQFKNFAKKIVDFSNKVRLKIGQIDELQTLVKRSIIEKSSQLNKKFELPMNVPNWNDFNDIVISKFFSYKRKSMKMTNSMFGEWVHEYKNRTFMIGLGDMNKKELILPAYKFSPIIIIYPPQE